VSYITGEVTRKLEKDCRKMVEFSLIGHNQEDELSIQGHAVAALPSRGDK
jgi:hypothetical protein